MAIKNPTIQALLDAYVTAHAPPTVPQMAAIAADAADYLEAVATAGLKYSGHRFTVKGGLLFFDTAQRTRAVIETGLAALTTAADAAEVQALSLELKGLLT